MFHFFLHHFTEIVNFFKILVKNVSKSVFCLEIGQNCSNSHRLTPFLVLFSLNDALLGKKSLTERPLILS